MVFGGMRFEYLRDSKSYMAAEGNWMVQISERIFDWTSGMLWRSLPWFGSVHRCDRFAGRISGANPYGPRLWTQKSNDADCNRSVGESGFH